MISKNTVSIRAFLVIAIILPTFALLWLVKPDEPISYEYNAKLGDLAYGIPSSLGYTVYIEESEGYQPYYVLTNSYNGQGGTAQGWWTRSISTKETASAWFINTGGTCEVAAKGVASGIRPAVCLRSDLSVKLQKRIVPDKEVYVMDCS